MPVTGWEVFCWALIAAASLVVLGAAAAIVVGLIRTVWITAGADAQP